MYNGKPHRKELDGLMGMCEMECALELMLQKAERMGIGFNELRMRPNEFSDDTLVGFCHLLSSGLMRPLYPNNNFGVSPKLIDEMRKRECWKNISAALTFQQYFDMRTREGKTR